MRTIEYKAQCKNINELFVLFEQAKNLEIKIAGEDEVKINANVLADMEKITSLYNILRLETKALLKQLKFSDEEINRIRNENDSYCKEDIKVILEQARKS